MTTERDILNLANAIREAGGRAMLVGGCVRDELMGIAPKDWDLEVYGIEPDKLRELLDEFGDVKVVGEAFAVYKLGNDLDVSLPRRERKTGRGHRGFVVEGDPDMSFEEACSRRDFTVNAILKDPLTGEIVDPFDGRGDIGRKTLRHVSDTTFPEDSLRVLRAAQFAARLEFDIAPETAELCRSIDVTDLPRERVWGEVEKILLKAQRPSIGLRLLYDLNVVVQLFPELQTLVGVPQEPDWHPEGDVDVHTLMVVDEARKLIDDLRAALRLESLSAEEQQKRFKLPPGFEIQLVADYRGASLAGKVIRVTNRGGKSLTLSASDLAPKDTLAVSIANPVLEPGTSTTAFVVGATSASASELVAGANNRIEATESIKQRRFIGDSCERYCF